MECGNGTLVNPISAAVRPDLHQHLLEKVDSSAKFNLLLFHLIAIPMPGSMGETNPLQFDVKTR